MYYHCTEERKRESGIKVPVEHTVAIWCSARWRYGGWLKVNLVIAFGLVQAEQFIELAVRTTFSWNLEETSLAMRPTRNL